MVELIFYPGEIRKFQGEPQFLRRQSPRSKTSTELFKQAMEQEGQRFEQHNRMLQCDRFFKDQRRFDGNEGAGSSAARQFLPTQAGLSQAFAQGHFGQGSERAQIANAPTIEGFEQGVGEFLLFAFEVIAE